MYFINIFLKKKVKKENVCKKLKYAKNNGALPPVSCILFHFINPLDGNSKKKMSFSPILKNHIFSYSHGLNNLKLLGL